MKITRTNEVLMFDQEIFVENQHRTKVRKTGCDLIQLSSIPFHLIKVDLIIETRKKNSYA